MGEIVFESAQAKSHADNTHPLAFWVLDPLPLGYESGRENYLASFTALARADALVRRVVGNHSQMVDFFDALSTRHRIVVAFGVPVHLKPQEPLVWTELPAGARVERVRPLGRPGGTPGCPAVRLVPAEDERIVPLLERLSQAWSAV